MTQRLLDEFLQTLDVAPGNTRRLLLIGMVGLPGTGKSTFAAHLAQRINLRVTITDAARRFLSSHGQQGDELQRNVELFAHEMTLYMLYRKTSHIMDGDLIRFYKNAHQEAVDCSAKFILIHVTCSDDIARQRIEQRLAAIAAGMSNSLSRADIEEYEKRKRLHLEIGIPPCDFRVDTEQLLEPQIDTIVQALQEDGCL